MSLEDRLRRGTVSREEFDALEQRIQNLEATTQGDGAAVPSLYTINKAGEVTQIENTTIVEAPEVEEGEGDLLVVIGGKTRRLKPGPAGTFLSSNGKKLIWKVVSGGGFKQAATFPYVELKWSAEAEEFTSELKNVALPPGLFAGELTTSVVMTLNGGFRPPNEHAWSLFGQPSSNIEGWAKTPQVTIGIKSDHKEAKGAVARVNLFVFGE